MTTFLLRHIFLLLSSTILVLSQLKSYNGSGPIDGQTPCCLDRMTTVSCNRLQILNSALFVHNCMNNADFAFIQCCKSCFDLKQSFSLHLNYSRTVELLLTNPHTASCIDRRGDQFCEQLVRRKYFWGYRKYKKLDCSSMPFAFRVCRKSCGYCSSGTKKAGAVYDYETATDPTRCNNPAYGLALLPLEPRGIVTASSYRKLRNRFTFRPNKITMKPPSKIEIPTKITTDKVSIQTVSTNKPHTITSTESPYSTEGTIPPPVDESTYQPVPEETTDEDVIIGPQIQEVVVTENVEEPKINPILSIQEYSLMTKELSNPPNFEAWWMKSSPTMLRKLFGPKYAIEDEQFAE